MTTYRSPQTWHGSADYHGLFVSSFRKHSPIPSAPFFSLELFMVLFFIAFLFVLCHTKCASSR